MALTMVRAELAQRGPPTFSGIEQSVVDGPAVVPKLSKMTNTTTDLSQEERRLATFREWPPDAPVSAKKLAQGGFVCVSHTEGVTQCFQCGVRISNWKIADSVVDRHRTERPNCAFVRSLPSPRASSAASPTSPTGVTSSGTARHPESMHVDSMMTLLPRTTSAPLANSRFCEPVPRTGVENGLLLQRLQASEEERFNTFYDWPLDYLPARALAQAGFYYIHEQDKVKCAFCKGVVHNWEPGDDPLHEHARHFPCCPFLLNPDLAGHDECGHMSWQQARSGPESAQLLVGQGSQGVQLKGSTPPSELSGLGVSVHVGPKHPAQASPDARLRTFEKWPATCPKRPQELIVAGFFYIGVQDFTKCFHCDGGLCNWDANDDPWEEHARWFPRCQFVLLSKGEAYVKDCLRRHQSHLSAVAASASTSSQGQSGGEDEGMATEVAALMRSEDVQFYLSQGVPAETLRAALLKHMRSQSRGFASRDELLQVLGDLLALPRSSADQTPQRSATNGVAVTKVATSPEQKESLLSRAKNSSSEGLSEGSEPSDLALENLRLKDQRLCKVCLDAEVGVVFLPCGHLVACPACASALSDCPVCRASIRGTVRTFFS